MGVVGEAQIVLELDQDGVPEDQVQGEVQKEVLLHGIQKEEEVLVIGSLGFFVVTCMSGVTLLTIWAD